MLIRTIGGSVIALILVVSGGEMRVEAQMFLDVMTFNLRTANGQDGDNAWPYRKELVAQTIARAAPHVIGLQEVAGEQIEYLEQALPEYRWLGIDRGLNGGKGLSEYTPIFYRHTELTPIESGNFWLTTTPDIPPEIREFRGRRRRLGRIVTWARFHHVSSGRQVYAYNTHLTLRRGERQVDSARLIAQRIASLPAGSAVLVTGDFNAPAGKSDTWRAATGHGLKDAWIVAEEREGPPFTLSMFGPPIDWDVGRIDWLLVGGPIRVHSVETVLHNDHGRYPSDHYPVSAHLEIGP